jgi:hypothetical protein
VVFYNNRTKTQIVIVIVSELAEKFTKNNSKYIMKFVKMNQKKNRRIQDFLHHFFAGKTENKINFDIIPENNSNLNNFKESYWEKTFSFPNYVLLKIGFSLKNAINFAHLYTKKSLIRAGTVG